jgi:secondary thiamine-phosphate synthase enzyme
MTMLLTTEQVTTERYEIRTNGHGDAHDITALVATAVAHSTRTAGLASIFVIGSAAAVTTLEFDPDVMADLKRLFERIAPRWGDDDGVNHVRAALIGPSLTVPFADKRLLVDASQHVVLLEFDTLPRSREVVVQVIGE